MDDVTYVNTIVFPEQRKPPLRSHPEVMIIDDSPSDVLSRSDEMMIIDDDFIKEPLAIDLTSDKLILIEEDDEEQVETKVSEVHEILNQGYNTKRSSALVAYFMNEMDRLITDLYDENRHQELKNKEFEFKCKQSNCTHSFVDEANLQKHLQNDHKAQSHAYVCDKCSLTYDDKEKYIKHKKMHLAIGYANDDTSDGLTEECESMMEKSINMTSISVETPEIPDLWECHLCHPCRGVQSRLHLQDHLNKCHSWEESFKCVHCQKGFPSRSQWHCHKFNCGKEHLAREGYLKRNR